MGARETTGNSTIMQRGGVVFCYIARMLPRRVDIAKWRSADARLCCGGVRSKAQHY